jgi:proline iminopeptidase
MLTLYPVIEPCTQIQLQVDPLHHLHVEQSGNPDGIPVVFLHGGPGAGSNENHRRYFDPARYRIINFDQRGCHRSITAGEIRQNTTADLLLDIERIRQHLGIDSWLVFGGSWGATLALLYAQQYPQRVRGLVLRGVFLARRTDRDWFFTDGVNRLFPDAWDRFRRFIATTKQQDLVAAYYQCMTAGDEALAIAAASQWADWTATIVTWLLNPGGFNPAADPVRLVNEVRIETHYAHHDYFIEENQILRRADTVPRVPTIIIHGRRDLTCTLDAAWQLHQALPGSELVIVREGGHLASEPVMIDALVTATNTMVTRLTR